MEKLGAYAFLLGVIIAVIVGAAVAATTLDTVITQGAAAILVLLGAVVGFLNIHDKETTPFLVSAIALGFGASVAFTPLKDLGVYLTSILTYLVVFVVPAAIVVALKTIWDSASQ